MASKFGGVVIKCDVCDKAVYQQEKMEAGGRAYHKICFKCSKCKMSLKLQNYTQDHGTLYCKNDFQKYVTAVNTQAAIL